jgi:hypothetical protein
MGWAIGTDPTHRRHIGYGVPAKCEHPECDEDIDRGLSYACGGGVMEDVPNCGLFFCGKHLVYVERDVDDEEHQGWVCQRCADGKPPFDPKPETPEWAKHVTTDPSWAEWRAENPDLAETMAAIA